jgi:hypothetical protein
MSERLVQDIAAVLNRHNAEIGSDTPDFILAAFLVSCLMSFDAGVKARSDWYGRHDSIGKEVSGE